jgi:hypothetical protein
MPEADMTTKAGRSLACGILLIVATWVETGPAAAAPPRTTPIFECAFRKPGTTAYITVWGYQNTNKTSETYAIGPRNRFTPQPYNRGQPVTFVAGRHDNVLTIDWDGRTRLQWRLGSATMRATTAQVCPTNPVPLAGSMLLTVVVIVLGALGGAALGSHLRRQRTVRQPVSELAIGVHPHE